MSGRLLIAMRSQSSRHDLLAPARDITLIWINIGMIRVPAGGLSAFG